MRVLQFNQDASCCVVSPTDDTVRIYNCDPFGKCFEFNTRNNNAYDTNDEGSPTSMRLAGSNDDVTTAHMPPVQNEGLGGDDKGFVVEMLFSTSLVAICDRNQGPIKGKRLKIVNTKRKSVICELVFPHEIVDVAMNRKRMCILLENDQLFIYDISCMKPLETIDIWESSPQNNDKNKDASTDATNVGAIPIKPNEYTRKRRNSLTSRIRPRIVLSNDDRSILCYTTFSASKGKSKNRLLTDIVVFDALNIKPINYINNVHKGNIACIALNADGKLIATASEKGTIIRVFNTGVDIDFDSNRQLQYEFRRGTRPANIYQLEFNKQSNLLGCIGDTDTVHLFSLDNETAGVNSLELENSENITSSEIRDNSTQDYSVNTQSTEKHKQFANFISRKIKDSITGQSICRDFAHISVSENVRYRIGFPDEYTKEVYLVGDDKKFLIYSIPTKSGECILSKSSMFE
ncbi:Atg21 protein [Maudiozyma humilis]|uniref:Atg21 protein n=1 Tax=Maudiozyma humilis TaxID=51915 RepID=A0AAV5S3C6_MAUHU|nr:Atg21 protein [Kazachstania humilis]